MNGPDDLTRKQYGYGDNNYTSIAKFIDKSIMAAAYALKCESFKPSVIVDAPSSSKFNLYYCTRLSSKLGVPYERNFFQRDMVNVKMDEEMMRNDGVDEKQIASFRETAKQKGISEIVYFIGQPIENHFNEYGDYLTEILGDKISLDRTPDGYIAMHTVLIEERIDMLDSKLLQDEFIQWVIDTITEEKKEAPSCVVYMNPTAD